MFSLAKGRIGKKLLVGAVLIWLLLLGKNAQTDASDGFLTVILEELVSQPYDREDVWRGLELLKKYYIPAMRKQGLFVKNPRPITIYIFDFALGFYFPSTTSPSIIIFYDTITKHYKGPDAGKILSSVVAHELGHHLLLEAGMPTEKHHKFIYCNVQPLVDKEFGFDPDLFACFINQSF